MQRPANLKPLDLEALIDAIAEVVGWSGHGLSAELVAITLIAARLGAVTAALRIGLLIVGDLRGRVADRRGPHH